MTPVPLLALLVLLSPRSPAQALAWADRLYAKVAPLPKVDPRVGIIDALEAYKQVNERFPSPRAKQGIGNCWMLLGQYSQAQRAYGNSEQGREAAHRGQIARACARFEPGRSVLQVERVLANSDHWIVLFAKVKRDPEGSDCAPRELASVCLRQFRVQNSLVKPIGAAVSVLPIADLSLWSATLYVALERWGKEPMALVYQTFERGQVEPSKQSFFRIGSASLSPRAHFEAKSEASVYAATPSKGLHILVDPYTSSWKRAWKDTYEWNGDRFIFANSRFPEHYRPAEILKRWEHRDYLDKMKLAAALTIQGQRSKAIQAWKAAERECRLAIRDEDRRSSPHHVTRHWGEHTENLKEIRQRIQWLQKGDLNHALLYRPLDSNLEVPPFRLVRAEQ